MKRSRRLVQKELEEQVVSEEMLDPIELLVSVANELGGPVVAFDHLRGWGLRAEKKYLKGELVTTYGGVMSLCPSEGDYVAKANEVFIDGRHGFKLKEKGRWINESDRDRTCVNVSLGRNVRAIREIKEGEWIFADYGPDYQRSY